MGCLHDGLSTRWIVYLTGCRLSFCWGVFLIGCLPGMLSTWWALYLPAGLSTWWPFYLTGCCLTRCLPGGLSTYRAVYWTGCPDDGSSTGRAVCPVCCLPGGLSIRLSTWWAVCLNGLCLVCCPPGGLSIHLQATYLVNCLPDVQPTWWAVYLTRCPPEGCLLDGISDGLFFGLSIQLTGCSQADIVYLPDGLDPVGSPHLALKERVVLQEDGGDLQRPVLLLVTAHQAVARVAHQVPAWANQLNGENSGETENNTKKPISVRIMNSERQEDCRYHQTSGNILYSVTFFEGEMQTFSKIFTKNFLSLGLNSSQKLQNIKSLQCMKGAGAWEDFMFGLAVSR